MSPLVLSALAGIVLAVNGQHHDGQGQTVSYINITGSDITVENYRIVDSGAGTNAVSVWGDRNTLRNLQIERSGATGVYFVRGDGHVLEDSVIRDPVTRQGQDSWGISSDAATNLTVRNNTVHGSGYTQWNPVSVGTRILNNTFAIPDDYRTDCKGNPQANGPC
ncbi:MAG: right-handed parallel beta-helix repeat-containing protein, partial [Gammaproteobacteria bacterium]|nr:right-handed parallel beta-helix repeat-containing protein [Gammaproteobacteria bacterium]